MSIWRSGGTAKSLLSEHSPPTSCNYDFYEHVNVFVLIVLPYKYIIQSLRTWVAPNRMSCTVILKSNYGNYDMVGLWLWPPRSWLWHPWFTVHIFLLFCSHLRISLCACVLTACTEYTVKKENCGRGNEILNDVDSLSSTDAPGPTALNQLGQFIMKQSYLIALIITMVM